MTGLQLEDRGGIGILWFDRAGSGPNLLDMAVIEELPRLLERIESAERISALVVASRKADGFMAGADIALFDRLGERSEAVEMVRNAQSLVERLAGLSKPVVAAIHGACAGGGLELAMACDYRLASTGPSTSFSLPEVQLGLLPALGGTQRLPRLIGLASGLEMLLSGRKVYARRAQSLGLIDSTVHPEGLVRAAVEVASSLAAGNYRGAAGRNRTRSVASEMKRAVYPLLRGLMESGPGREIIFRRALDETHERTKGNYPAPERIIEVVRRTFGGPLDEGLELEAHAFADLLFTRESRSLRHLFFVRAAGRRNPLEGKGVGIERIGVVGGGLMGAGIAQACSFPGGYGVELKDLSFELAARGKGAVYRGLTEQVGKGLTAFRRDAAVERVRATGDYRGFATVGLTVEAVVEDLELKRAVLREVEDSTTEGHVFASNTSSLPISRIAAGARRPDRVVGMHYFSPVPKMPLLEVVRSERSSEEAVATAVAVGVRQGKVVITVADSPGFYVNRILAPYLNEAVLCVQEGAAIDQVDTVMEQAGFPVGPFRLLDNVGLDIASKVTPVLAPLFSRRGVELVDFGSRLSGSGLQGRKAGRGFYLYPTGGERSVNPTRGKRTVNEEVYRLLGIGSRTLAAGEIRERLLLAMVNESVRCLAEGIISSAHDGDAGAVFGIGFPPFLGGPFHSLEASGREQVRSRLESLAEQHGVRFQPAPGL